MIETKKAVEPFNLFGERSLIFTKEQAAKILKDNSYYIFIAAAILLAALMLLLLVNKDIYMSKASILMYSIYYFILGSAIRYLKSRIASILAVISFSYVLVARIIDNDMGGLFAVSFIFVAASYRCVRASFFYHNAKL